MTIRRGLADMALLLAPALCPVAAVAADLGDRPALSVETLDGGRFDLAEQRGQWVVVNFWATWCPPCIKEIPDLSDFDGRRDDARVIGLAFEEIERAELEAFLERHPAGYPIAHVDPYEPLADFAAPRGLPMTYLIDPEGRVAKKFLGPVTGKDLDAAILAVKSGDG